MESPATKDPCRRRSTRRSSFSRNTAATRGDACVTPLPKLVHQERPFRGPRMGQLITIDDSNYHQFLSYTDPGGDSRAKGLKPRNFFSHPQGYLGAIAEPFSLPLIPESQ